MAINKDVSLQWDDSRNPLFLFALSSNPSQQPASELPAMTLHPPLLQNQR